MGKPFNYGRIAGIIGGISNLIQARGSQRWGAVGGLLDLFMPQFGGIFSALGGLAGAFGGHKGITVDRILEPVKTMPAELSIFSAANPASRAYAGNFSLLGPAFRLDLGWADGADQVLEAKVASASYGKLILGGA